MGESHNDVEAGKEVKKAGNHGDSPSKVEIMPEMLAAMNSPSFQRATYLAGLSPQIRKRVRALKKLQLEEFEINKKFFEELHKLECKYAPLYAPGREKRRDIIAGKHEPTEEECDLPNELDGPDDLAEDLKKASLENKDAGDNGKVNGVPDFWLLALQGFSITSEMLEEYDEPILKHLIDIQCHLIENPIGFKLEFHFSPNDYFTDTVLTKEYAMSCDVDTTDPWAYEGTEITKTTGCTIHWKEGKNVTQKVVKKRQKHKQKNVVRMVEKVVQRDSFFNFFSPPEQKEGGGEENNEDDDEEGVTGALLAADYEIGHYLKERFVPRATLFFTGDAIEQDDYDDGDEEDEEQEEDDDDDDGGEEKAGSKPARKAPHGGAAVAAGKQPQECKQQ